VGDDREDAVAVAAERLAERLDRRVPAAAGGDADGARAAAEGEGGLERPSVLVEPVRREIREAVRGEDAGEVDGLAAGAGEAKLGTIGHVTLNAVTVSRLP
jgi:hypothetical protein